MTILDGKKTSEALKQEIAEEVKQLKNQGKKVPHLAAVLVGDDGASLTYVGSKVKACEKVGFASTLVKLPADISEEKLLQEIAKLNANPEIDGYIVQLPLPKHINEQKILLAVDPKKDVDGFQKGAQGNATVTLTHSHTPNLADLTRQADIVVMALGIPEFLKGNMVKEGVTVIDVGITRLKDDSNSKGYRIVGDVAFNEVKEKASYITPVPGGVGPMTIAMLLKNTLLAYKWYRN